LKVEEKLQSHRSTQRIIVERILVRFSYLKYYIENYSEPNNFLQVAMSSIRTVIIIDLCKLYISPLSNEKVEEQERYAQKQNQKIFQYSKEKKIRIKYKANRENNNFHYVLHKYRRLFNEDVFLKVSWFLDSMSEIIEAIGKERDGELAHKDSKNGTHYQEYVSHNSEELEILIEVSIEIINLFYGEKVLKQITNVNSIVEIMNFVKDAKAKKDKFHLDQFKRFANKKTEE